MLSNKGKVISVTGPTCTGKSSLSVSLAEEFNGEIINCDSMQVYKYFDIGTAKPDRAMRNKIPHHLVGIIEPHEEFNAARFQEMADTAIEDILKRGKRPILVGGTGLYLRALIYGLFDAPKDMSLRAKLQDEYSEGPLQFYEKFKEIDLEYAMRISFKDKLRMVRAMEIFLLTGKRVSDLEKDHGFKEPRYDILKIGLKNERDELYGRINRRVDDMFAQGWVEEVKKILSMGISNSVKPFSSIGYREIILYLNDSISHEDMVKDIKQHTRRYAKRQFTWFAKEKGMYWFEYPKDSVMITLAIAEFLNTWN
ncbi:MAG: tRNA (adenosine(37)-N6)-dimethylallyltransferase MiaA [Syntrophus sp. (in: bacteria)]|nr:tRNA (adenosine(37)-N6)-dimethylallyltransferase MiaA [Syntrophus sp. (in: bacteria)]